MSIRIMAKVWELPMENHSLKLVTLALADNSNDQGSCWPSMSTLARKCDLTSNGVRNQLQKLFLMGLLKMERGGGRYSNRYQFDLDRLDELLVQTGQIPPINVVDPSTTLAANDVNPTPQRGAPQQLTPLTPAVNPVDPNHNRTTKEPLENQETHELLFKETSIADLVHTKWNELAKAKSLPKIIALTAKRKAAINARVKDEFFRANWEAALLAVGESSFCCGENDRTWKASLDWFLRPDICVKIMERKYANREKVTKERKDHEGF